jgi:hypothetical protein
MDDHHPQSANTAQRLAHRHPINVRQPISCEPCRHRKIKCSRTRPSCETCRRRGCVDRCVYKGSRDNEPSTSGGTSNGNDELLSRISNLEKLLQKHTGTDIPNEDGVASSMLSPPTEFGENSHLSPESLVSDSSSHPCSSNFPSTHRVGVLTSTINGNVGMSQSLLSGLLYSQILICPLTPHRWKIPRRLVAPLAFHSRLQRSHQSIPC